jgi:hypothetical protein
MATGSRKTPRARAPLEIAALVSYRHGMSRLNLEHGGDARRQLALERLYRPREASFVAPDHDALYHYAASVVGNAEPMTYIEFGVAQGNSLRKMVREFAHPDCLFVGFDSFIGLPDDWLMHKRGAFSTGGHAPDIDDRRIRFVPGWFQNTLHESLAWLSPRLSGPVLVHYDADLYSSTLFLLTSLWPYCREYYFIMDDFMQDDIVALHDFSTAYPVKIEFLGRLQGGLPHVAFGKMARTQFVL